MGKSTGAGAGRWDMRLPRGMEMLSRRPCLDPSPTSKLKSRMRKRGNWVVAEPRLPTPTRLQIQTLAPVPTLPQLPNTDVRRRPRPRRAGKRRPIQRRHTVDLHPCRSSMGTRRLRLRRRRQCRRGVCPDGSHHPRSSLRRNPNHRPKLPEPMSRSPSRTRDDSSATDTLPTSTSTLRARA